MMERQPTKKFSPEVRQRAVRMVLEHRGEHASEWAALGSIAGKIGCTAEAVAPSWLHPLKSWSLRQTWGGSCPVTDATVLTADATSYSQSARSTL